MKRFILILLAILLLCGCSAEDPDPTQVTEATEPTVAVTEPPVPWVQEIGMPWDREGVLLEVPLTIPDGLHYSAAMEFDGDLLLWSMDSHLLGEHYVELCLIDLDDGSVIAQRDVQVSSYISPRTVGEYLYLCDNYGGHIYKLDSNLQTVSHWTIEDSESNVYLSANDTAYLYDYSTRFQRYDLQTGETSPVLEGDPDICWITEGVDSLIIKYYQISNGAPAYAVLDLTTDECHYAFADRQISAVKRIGDNWLYEKYLDGYIYYLQTEGAEMLRFQPGDLTMTLLKEGYLLGSTLEGTVSGIYQLDGTLVSSCSVFENGNGYVASELIWNESMGGYFFLANSYEETSRLLFWDITRSIGGEDLILEPLPEPDAIQAQLEARAEELGEKFGITILVGNQCDTQFDEFSATLTTDLDLVNLALDTLDKALSGFPEGFISQLRYGDMKGIRIQLIRDLQAEGGGRTGGGYNAFTQPQFDYYLMVMDVEDCYVETYHHEMSHIIDTYLEWDAGMREDALYSETAWADLNPSWFTGYSYDYTVQHDLIDYTAFIDGYATISPTEDRARVLEYAMYEYGAWAFENAPVLQKKLNYYCRCIRDAFDTTNWPDTVLWEQYLN